MSGAITRSISSTIRLSGTIGPWERDSVDIEQSMEKQHTKHKAHSCQRSKTLFQSKKCAQSQFEERNRRQRKLKGWNGNWEVLKTRTMNLPAIDHRKIYRCQFKPSLTDEEPSQSKPFKSIGLSRQFGHRIGILPRQSTNCPIGQHESLFIGKPNLQIPQRRSKKLELSR